MALACSRLADLRATAIDVAWHSSRSRVRAIDVRVAGKTTTVAPKRGAMRVRVEVEHPGGPAVVTARYEGPPVTLLVGKDAEHVPATVVDAFRRREQLVNANDDALSPIRRRFLELDRHTHLELLSLLPLDAAERTLRERAIAKTASWLWRRTVRLAAAYLRDVDATTPTWPEFEGDFRHLSTLLIELLGPAEELPATFASFANGELVLEPPSPHGGPDGPYYTLFAGFARAAGDNASPVTADERAYWRTALEAFVGTLPIFAANYRAPAGSRTGRSGDFDVLHHVGPRCDAATKRAHAEHFVGAGSARGGFQRLCAALDRFVASMFFEDVNDCA